LRNGKRKRRKRSGKRRKKRKKNGELKSYSLEYCFVLIKKVYPPLFSY